MIGINSCFERLIFNLKNRTNLDNYSNLFKKISWAVANFLTTSDKINMALLESRIIKSIIDVAIILNNVKVFNWSK